MSILGSILGGVAGSGLNALSGFLASAQAFKYNKQLIQMQQDWQERMSNTAHQREVSDMRKAGLNPILSATGGSGASFGSASAPGMSVDLGQSGTDSLNSALAIRQQKNNDKIADSQTKLNENSAKGAIWDALIKQSTYDDVIPKQIKEIESRIGVNSAQAQKIMKEAEYQTIANKYAEKTLSSAIDKTVSETEFNKRRASGKSRSYSGSLNVGNKLFGVGGSGSYSETN